MRPEDGARVAAGPAGGQQVDLQARRQVARAVGARKICWLTFVKCNKRQLLILKCHNLLLTLKQIDTK